MVGIALLFIPFVCIAGIALAVIGFVLLIVAAVMEQSPPMYYPQAYGPYQTPGYPPYPQVGQPTQPQPTQPAQPMPQMQPTQVPAGMQPQTPQPYANPHCPRCGQPLEFVYQYQRWYCREENVYPWG